MRIHPDDAWDFLNVPVLFEEFIRLRGLDRAAAKAELLAAITADDVDAPPLLDRRAGASSTRANECRLDAATLAAAAKGVPLPPRLRQVYQLCIIDGLSRRECAARLHISVETVRRHLRRLRQLTRPRPDPDGGTPVGGSAS